MMLFRLILLCFLTSTCLAEKIDLSVEESCVLNQFFQVLIEDSEVGYVLLNKKPVCIHGFFNRDPFLVDALAHKHSVALREGARMWKELAPPRRDVVIQISGQEDACIPNWIHVLAINRPLFREVVQSNLAAFQYVLGPAVSADSLLEALGKETYHCLLKGDKVLIGEILGFGEQNALYVSRIENLEEACDQDVPPFLNTGVVVREYPNEHLPDAPSFGFASINEELEALQEKVSFPSEKLVRTCPEFVFGCLKEETRGLIGELEVAQGAIQRSLQSSAFLEETLQRLTGVEYVRDGKKAFSFKLNQVNEVVAKGIWESVQDYDRDCLASFVEGMGRQDVCEQVEREACFASYRRELLEAKEGLLAANQLLGSLEAECVIPNGVYYKTVKVGQGVTCKGPLVKLTYSVFSPLGHCLAYQSDVVVNLKNTIPGFALGVRGMKVGETREIFIHPSMGYGLDKCMHLRAVVTLVAIGDDQGFVVSDKPMDLSFVLDEKVLSERTEKYKAALFSKGVDIANHLRKCPEIDLVSVCDQLKKFLSGQDQFVPTNEAEQALINKVHWNIYFGSS